MAMHIRIPSNAQTNPDPLASNNVSPNAFLSNGSLLSPSVSPHGSNDADHKDANLREVWQNTMCRNWKIPNGYQNVAVLLIRWDDSVDELNCADQVQELETTFKDKFNFTTDVLKLDGESKAQHQLRRGLSAFLGKYDDPSNLVIVYYTGHSVFDEGSEHLEIAAYSQRKNTVADNFTRASWNTAEQSLFEEVECDVLGILDCSFASDIVSEFPDGPKKNHPRDAPRKYFSSLMRPDERPDLPVYEMLTASGPGQALNYLAALKKPFSAHALNQQIIKYSKDETISCLLNRDAHPYLTGRHIRLRVLDPSIKRQDSFTTNPIKSYLTLKFALCTDSLTKEQIKYLVQRLTKACKDDDDNAAAVGVRRIDWIGLNGPARPSGMRYTAAAIHTAKRWRRNTIHRKGGLTPSSPSTSPSPTRHPEPMQIQTPSVTVVEVPEQIRKIIIEPSCHSVLFDRACEVVLGGAFLIIPSAFLMWYWS